MASSVKNILIAIFVILAIGIIIFMILFLHPSVGDNAKTLHVRFANVDKVNVGTRVTFAGRPVGEVVSIRELPDARAQGIARNGDVYVYELTLKVDSAVHVYNTDEISVRTSGLLGEKNVEIDPQPLKQGEHLFLVEDQVLYAVPTGSVEDILKQFGELSAKFEHVLNDFHEVMLSIKKEKIVENISKTIRNTVEISEALNQPEKIDRIINNIYHATSNVLDISQRARRNWSTIEKTLDNFYEFSHKAKHSWTSLDSTFLEFNNASKEFNQAAGNFRQFSVKAQEIIARTATGEGTIGRLFVSDDLYLRLKSIFHKGETIFNDIKQFGVLFQLDKRWQRLQARRMRLLEKFSSPDRFAHHFTDEVDQISTSLSSMAMVLNEAECYPYSLLQNPEFASRFADLLRRVSEMEDALKMYNEQVVDLDSKECQ
ncbi:MAG: MlaD family protein [Parachlamydia sp.]|jgi:phospholipid/cholesterol/gamma-HCH transport system substrate-binding protein|nr:MlaD family protein [Parachlamydia sp.]